MRRSRFILLSVLVLALLALGACGGQTPAGDTGGDGGEAAQTEQEPTQPAASEGNEESTGGTEASGPEGCNIAAPDSPATIDMIGWAFPITEFYAKELEKCNDVENLTVNTQLLDSGSAQEQARLALSSGGTPPFEIVHADDGFIVQIGSEGWLYPLDDLIETYSDEYNLGDISDNLWGVGTIDGKRYGVPIVANTMMLMYRQDLLDKYNLEVPETYDDVIAACETLQQEDSIVMPFTMNLHAGWAWRTEFHNFLKGYGGKWLNDDNTPAFNSPEGVAAVEKMLDVVDACMGEEGLTWSIDDSEVGLETGDLAMANIWASRAANMKDPELSSFVEEIQYAPAPRPKAGGPHGGPAAVDFYTIPADTEVDPDLIFRTIMEAADQESQMGAAELAIVTRQSVMESEVSGSYVPPARETIENGAGNYGSNPAVFLARTAIANNLPNVATGSMTPQEALDAAAEAYVQEATAQGFLDEQ